MDEGRSEEDETAQLEQLRRELLSGEQRRIEAIERELRDPRRLSARVASVLPRAIRLSAQKDKQLAWSLQPTLRQSIRETVRMNREELAETLYPVMAPSIARAIKGAIAEMLQRLNQVLSISLSPRSVGWRIEALRTGRPFAEVAMLRTLVYRVEQVLLVHKDSGVLLAHILRPGVEAKDPASVSALLTALQAFSKEAFRARGGLERLEAENLSVRIETGTRLMIAAVVRGTPPETLGATLSQTLERVQLELAEPIERFSGDITPFEPARPELMECLEGETRVAPEGRAKWIGIGLVCAVVLAALLAGFAQVRARRFFDRGIAALKAEPGLVVLSSDHRGGVRHVQGLKDPKARSPEEALRSAGLDPSKFKAEFAPYPSMAPEFIEQRVRSLLAAPSTVTLAFAPGQVTATGFAPRQWVQEAKARMQPWGDFIHFSTDRLYPLEDVEKARAAAQALSRSSVRFPTGMSKVPIASGQWDQMGAAVEKFFRAASAAGLDARIEVVGEADPPGTPQRNRELAQERAEHVKSALIDAGAPAARVKATPSERLTRREARVVGTLSLPKEAGG